MTLIAANAEVTISFTLNGEPVRGRCPPRMHLADFLRHVLHRTGTHIGCEHGICGACTVLIEGKACRSCLVYAVQVSGTAITTVEGLAQGSALSPLQQAFKDYFALQCGFCTPGILMSATDFIQHVPTPTEQDVRDMLGGHLCRCTGYESIVRAIMAAAEAARGSSTPPTPEIIPEQQ